MTLATKHKLVSTKADGTDATLLRPSNWNDDHNITLATGMLIGRQSAGDGAAEEIPCSAAAASMLAASDIPGILAALGISPPTTGDGKFTFKTAADPGWVLMNDNEIGDALSGANNRANADTADLFRLLFNNVSDAAAPIFTTSGGSIGPQTSRAAQGTAAEAFAAHCRMLLPKQLGRAIVMSGTGSSLTSRALGSAFGEESHTLTATEIPSITSTNSSSFTISASGNINSDVAHLTGQQFSSGTNGNPFNLVSSGNDSVSVSGTVSEHTIPISSTNTGNGAHNNMQPSTAWNVMVKL